MSRFLKFMRCSLLFSRKAIHFQTLNKSRHSTNPLLSRKYFKHLLEENYYYDNFNRSQTSISNDKKILLAASLAFLGFFKKDEEKEPELITTIKRSILCMQVRKY